MVLLLCYVVVAWLLSFALVVGCRCVLSVVYCLVLLCDVVVCYYCVLLFVVWCCLLFVFVAVCCLPYGVGVRCSFVVVRCVSQGVGCFFGTDGVALAI